VDIGIEPDEEPEDPQTRLLEAIRKTNLSLAAVLDKALRWDWSEEELLLVFGSQYESSLVTNETEVLRRTAEQAGLGRLNVRTVTESIEDPAAGQDETPRVALVRQVFRGQIIE